MTTPDIQLVGKYSNVYNACDRAGYHRGVPAEGQKAPARIYSVYAFDIVDGVEIARTQSWDCWGGLHEKNYPLGTLEPYGPRKA